MNEEVWKPIAEFPSYEVSSKGRIKDKKGLIHKTFDNGNGYLVVGLSANNHHYNRRVSRLVASAFLPNPENHKEVNHINEDKYDNRVENLEWCTRTYNVRYGNRTKKAVAKRARAVDRYDKDGTFVKRYNIMKDAIKDGFDNIMVCKCCKGNKKSHKGYIFKYAC